MFSNIIYSCDGKAEFSSVITPVFNVTRSFRNFVKKHLIVLSVLQLMLNILVETKKKNVQENLKLQVLFLIQLIRCPGQILSTGPCQSWPPNNPHPLDWLYDSLSSPPVAGVWWVHWRRCIVAAVTSSKWMLHTGGGWGETPPHDCKALWVYNNTQ